jgi:hypothetical protein
VKQAESRGKRSATTQAAGVCSILMPSAARALPALADAMAAIMTSLEFFTARVLRFVPPAGRRSTN